VIFHALIIALVIRTFLFQPFNIPSGSMKATLLIGDYLFVSKYTYGYSRYSLPFSPPLFSGRIFASEPQRGDIVVFRLPKDDSTDYIKRVIGLPGDQIEVRHKRVFVNGERLDEPYVFYMDQPPPLPEDLSGAELHVSNRDPREFYGPVTVPPNHYFAMGDNRDNSQDSRYWGFLPRGYVKGRALVIYWSYDGEVGNILTGTRWSRLLHQVR
jgi:signal peptidase I